MKERPIIFSGPMVRAILEDRKFQTRRVAPVLLPGDKKYINAATHEEWIAKRVLQCPYGQPGDRLWVRETLTNPRNGDCWRSQYHYAEGGAPSGMYSTKDRPGSKPAIHMPRWASRILLEITQVRVERVQEITEADAIAEGMKRIPDVTLKPLDDTARLVFIGLWNDLNLKRGFGWEVNPWVWAISFKRVKP